MLILTMVLGNTKSLNYVCNDGICDQNWLTILLGNDPQESRISAKDTAILYPKKRIILVTKHNYCLNFLNKYIYIFFIILK